jgi:hypothetical protein
MNALCRFPFLLGVLCLLAYCVGNGQTLANDREYHNEQGKAKVCGWLNCSQEACVANTNNQVKGCKFNKENVDCHNKANPDLCADCACVYSLDGKAQDPNDVTAEAICTCTLPFVKK